jgi:hypothetical protein
VSDKAQFKKSVDKPFEVLGLNKDEVLSCIHLVYLGCAPCAFQ